MNVKNTLKATLGLATIAMAQTAFAATTGLINLSGSVAATYAIVVTPDSGASSLNIVNGESAKTVASVNETANNNSGYKVTVSSVNNGYLVHGTVNTSKVAYTINYGGTSVAPTTTVKTAKTSSSAALAPGANSTVNVTFTGLGTNALAGTYADTLNLEIGAP